MNYADVINRFYSSIADDNYREGAPNTRYKSWEYCRGYFLDCLDKERDPVLIDTMALHLGFYLASWGMYRGSSFLLQRDYKAHINTVNILFNFYDNQTDEVKQRFRMGVFNYDELNDIYKIIKGAYGNHVNNEDAPSDTLTTKILIGTFGCIPAFDRFLKKGISEFKNNIRIIRNIENWGDEIYNRLRRITQEIESLDNNRNVQIKKNTFVALETLSGLIEGAEDINLPEIYTPMKKVDMFLWEIGLEVDIIKILENGTDREKEGAMQNARMKNLINDNCNVCETARDEIITVIRNDFNLPGNYFN